MEMVTKLASVALGFTVLQGLRYLTIIPVAFFLLRKFNRWVSENRFQAKPLLEKDIIREVKYSALSILIFGTVMSTVANPWVLPHTMIYMEVDDYGWGWLVLSGFVVFLIHDTYFYWLHKTLHHPWFFKRFHYIHHLSSNPSPATSQSFHPVEGFLQVAWSVPVVFVIPFHPSVLVAFSILNFIYNVYGHMPVEFLPEKVRSKLPWMNTAGSHNIHHRLSSGNYGLYTKFWDRVMKTESKSSHTGAISSQITN